MPLVGDTGNGATFTLATQSAMNSYKIEKISIGEVTIEMLEVSNLATTGDEERIPSDLRKNGDWTIDVIHVATGAGVSVTGLVDTAVITFPAVGAATAGSTLTASGVLTSRKLPDLANGTVQKAQYKFSPDGDTGPTLA